jgi:hypothetical protein
MYSVRYLPLQSVKNSDSPWIRSYAFISILTPYPIRAVVEPKVSTPKNTNIQGNLMTGNKIALIDRLDTEMQIFLAT